MIVSKLWTLFRAMLNKIGNALIRKAPLDIMQLQVDDATKQLHAGREGLEKCQGFVFTLQDRVTALKAKEARYKAKAQTLITAGQRDAAAGIVIELNQIRADLTEQETDLKVQKETADNYTLKIKAAAKQIAAAQDKIKKYGAKLDVSRASAEIAQLNSSLDINITTDFGQMEAVIQDEINMCKGKVKVAADLSGEGIDEIKQSEAVEKALADQALRQFEIESGLVTPETTPIEASVKEFGAQVQEQT